MGRAEAAARSEAQGPGEHGGEALAIDHFLRLWHANTTGQQRAQST